MFAKNKISGIHQGTIMTQPSMQGTVAPHLQRQEIKASVPAGGTSVNIAAQSMYQYYLTGILPADPMNNEMSNLSLFYRDCYLMDSTAGSAVDIQSVFPFSDWELRGLTDKELQPFVDGLQALNIRQMMPEISVAYLVDGFFAGSLIYDERSKGFMDTLIHDALQCQLTPSPFYNMDPTIKVNVSASVQPFLNSQSEYARRYINSMPKSILDVMNEGSFTLDPVTTIFIGRKTLTDRAYTSYLHRVLPMYLIEKAMFRGTLMEAGKRQRAMTHITAGTDTWIPTGEELLAYVQEFQRAELDPLGGWIATRDGVSVNDLRQGGDFWKWTDMADTLVSYKMRALGISEAFLSGDASYAAAESAYSTFLESMNAYRSHLTSMVFYRRIFPLIAAVNGLYKDPALARKTTNPVDFLFNRNNINNLKIPSLTWHKSLDAKSEESVFDMLEKASEKGVPIPLKMWMAAANIDKENLVRDLTEDKTFTDALNKLKGDTENANPDDPDDEFNMTASRITSASMKSGFSTVTGLANRQFNSHEKVEYGRTGKVKAVINNPRGKQRDDMAMIAKIAVRMEKDPNYRKEVAKRRLKERRI